MSDGALVQLSLEGYVAFFACIALIIGLIYWFLQREERRGRELYLDQFEFTELRMSPYKVGLVYQVVASKKNEVTVRPIWDGKSRVVGGTEMTVAADKLIPFDKGRFL